MSSFGNETATTEMSSKNPHDTLSILSNGSENEPKSVSIADKLLQGRKKKDKNEKK